MYVATRIARAPPSCHAAGTFQPIPVALGGAAGLRATSGLVATAPVAGAAGTASGGEAGAGSVEVSARGLDATGPPAAADPGPGPVERRQATKPSTTIATRSTPAIQRIMFVDLAISGWDACEMAARRSLPQVIVSHATPRCGRAG